jgi:very-short-patch-repair endonuclease
MILPWLLQVQYQFFDYSPAVLLPGETDKYVSGTIAVIPQLPIGKYRADFALAGSLGGPIRFVMVECDGKEFHEGAENAKRDKTRDAAIRANPRVLDVVRIDGGLIACDAQQAAQYAAKRVLEAWRKGTAKR